MKKRLAFLTSAMPRAGVGILLADLAVRLQKRGWDVRILSMLPADAYPDFIPEIEKLERQGTPFEDLGMSHGIADPRAILKTASVIRRWKSTILHSHTVHANFLARAARPLMPRSIVTISTAHSVWEGRRWREVAYRLTDPFCDITTNVCQAAVDRFVEVGAVPAHRIRMIPNGVDSQKFKPDPEIRAQMREELNLESQFAWIAVGNIVKPKDYANMVRAFAQIHDHPTHPTLLIVGDGILREGTEALAESLNVAKQIRFLGLCRDVPKLLCAADAYVMSSAFEGMPLVLLEASSVGLPIVATNVGGNREVVVEGKSGFLMEPHDSYALAREMQRMMELPPETRQAMGETARQFVHSKYDIEHIVDLWEALYIEFLEKKC